ncbi:MAG: hypothetical protein FD133_1939, partial [Erysipelotrichaceae bacterium]
VKRPYFLQCSHIFANATIMWVDQHRGQGQSVRFFSVFRVVEIANTIPSM